MGPGAPPPPVTPSRQQSAAQRCRLFCLPAPCSVVLDAFTAQPHNAAFLGLVPAFRCLGAGLGLLGLLLGALQPR